MLKIVKKAEVKPVPVESGIVSEKDEEKKVRSLLEPRRQFSLEEIVKTYEMSPSINAQILAQIMHQASSKFTEQNHSKWMTNILKLYSLPHDDSEFRYNLKHKYRIDPVLVMLILWEVRDHPMAVRLASTIVDCYTLALMLNGKEVVAIWRRFVRQLRSQLQNYEQISSYFQKKELQSQVDPLKVKRESVVNGFRRIVIPL